MNDRQLQEIKDHVWGTAKYAPGYKMNDVERVICKLLIAILEEIKVRT